ncbi:MAG: exodeoxyribonuclease VII small subunit [Clostridiaceae bacterium]|nr:exodeoxyribonuclease VII small subunit [Clostridiaceae bacterium]
MNENEMTFEQAMTRLEEIVRAMERGDAPLAETLSLFEEGTKLCKLCSDALERATQRVTILTKLDDGHVVEQKFGDADGTN